MNKKQLMAALKDVPDNTPIIIRVVYTGKDGFRRTQLKQPTVEYLDNNIFRTVLLQNIDVDRLPDSFVSKSVQRRLKIQRATK